LRQTPGLQSSSGVSAWGSQLAHGPRNCQAPEGAPTLAQRAAATGAGAAAAAATGTVAVLVAGAAGASRERQRRAAQEGRRRGGGQGGHSWRGVVEQHRPQQHRGDRGAAGGGRRQPALVVRGAQEVRWRGGTMHYVPRALRRCRCPYFTYIYLYTTHIDTHICSMCVVYRCV
jgi:hypothetical protein